MPARIPTSAVVYEYRGRRFDEHHRDPDSPYERMLRLPEDWRDTEWTDGTVHGAETDDPWLSIGAGALDAAWVRTVRGRWRGCDVIVGADAHGSTVKVHYAGTDPAEADAAGFIGDSYQRWYAITDPEYVEVTEVTEEPRTVV